jgi:drug/metabolite transporter (DMT)-like permease
LVGTAMVLISATSFGTLPIFAKLGYSSGLGTEQTLAYRFTLAAVGMLALAFIVRQNPLRLQRRHLLALLAMGAIVYTGQSQTYFLALHALPASVVVLIVYSYPSLVVVAGWLFLDRRISLRHGAALVGSFAGVAMLIGGAHFQASWPLALAIVTPVIYTLFILLGERVMGDVPAVAGSAVIMTGAAFSFCLITLLSGELTLARSSAQWLVAIGIAIVPTMLAISLFLGSLPRVGAARASLLSTWEPVVAVGLAVAFLGDRLAFIQVVGGALVLIAVIAAQTSRPVEPPA